MVAVAKEEKKTSGFGRRLRELRKAAGLTLEQLGERAEMAYQAIARLERQEREPTWPTAIKLAEALGVSVADFHKPIGEAPVESDPLPDPKPPTKRGKK